MLKTPQTDCWQGNFGREYSDRNVLDPQALDDFTFSNYGIRRRDLNQNFLAGIPRETRILEVGCNVGNQLLLLYEMGFRNLSGIEIQDYALDRARMRLKDVNFQQASALQIPFPNAHFDLVFTAGVLIHIAPGDLPVAMKEIHRCARQYIWGFEYYSPETKEINYRGHQQLLWKMDYANAYLAQFPDLELVKNQQLPYLQNSNIDCMFLLRKNPSFGT